MYCVSCELCKLRPSHSMEVSVEAEPPTAARSVCALTPAWTIHGLYL